MTNLEKCKTQGALQYIFNYFYDVEMPSRIPDPEDTELKINAKDAFMNTALKFIVEKYMVENQYDKKHVVVADVYDDYCAFVEKMATANKAVKLVSMNKLNFSYVPCSFSISVLID